MGLYPLQSSTTHNPSTFKLHSCLDPSRPRLTPRPPFPASREGKKCHDLKIGLANRYGGPPFPLKNGRELEGWVQIDAL